jgi:hypothetical protein
VVIPYFYDERARSLQQLEENNPVCDWSEPNPARYGGWFRGS